MKTKIPSSAFWTIIIIVCIIIPFSNINAQDDSQSELLEGLAIELFTDYNWDQLEGALQAIIDASSSGAQLPEAAQQVLEQANLGGLGQLAALAGRSLGGEQIPPMEIAAAAQQVLTDMGIGGLGQLAEQAGYTLGGGDTDWMAVANAAQQVLEDMHLGGLGELAELAGRSLGGENIDWMDLERAARNTLDNLHLGWLGEGVANVSQVVGEFWAQFEYGGWSSIWGNIFGGICPTFIQPPSGKTAHSAINYNTNYDIFAAIAIPADDCLLRSDIPIYGIAGGKNFERYIVEYGVGDNPEQWFTIEESSVPQNHFNISQVPSLLQGDLDLRGNLATWNVGLKNWEHLPWHPASDTTDLNGVYTIRLTVFGKDGKKAEDRVVGTVGRVIAQCLPGIAISTDKKIVMHFPEQSLQYPFRVYNIQPISEGFPSIPKGMKNLSSIYQIQESGDCFIKPVELEMTIPKGRFELLDEIHICLYDQEISEWVRMDTEFDKTENIAKTSLCGLPAPEAFVVLLSEASADHSLALDTKYGSKNKSHYNAKPVLPRSDTIFLVNRFESGIEQWNERDWQAGARIEQICGEGLDGSCCLRISPKNKIGNFACTILDSPFDIRDYSKIRFDYKVCGNAEIDFFALVQNRWYRIGFTDQPNDYQYKDVNIADLGKIEGIVSDGSWHRASLDLREMLREKTKNTLISKIIMANWDVKGYMNLSFAENDPNAVVMFDNFIIYLDADTRQEKPSTGDRLIVEDFENVNRIFSVADKVFSSNGSQTCSAYPVELPSFAEQNHLNHALRIDYSIRSAEEFGGWYYSFDNISLEKYSMLKFDILCPNQIPKLAVGIKHSEGREIRVPIYQYLSEVSKSGWQHVIIPLEVFCGLKDLVSIENISIGFAEQYRSDAGLIYVDNIEFASDECISIPITDFNIHGISINSLGGKGWTFENGAAAISVSRDCHVYTHSDDCALRLAFGGKIGLDLGVEGFSYAGWNCQLMGLDLSDFHILKFDIRGFNGNDVVNVYLDDGTRRWPFLIADEFEINQAWQTISVPLKYFEDKGIDLTNILNLQFVFEWEEQSGVIWLDNLEVIKMPHNDDKPVFSKGGDS